MNANDVSKKCKLYSKFAIYELPNSSEILYLYMKYYIRYQRFKNYYICYV